MIISNLLVVSKETSGKSANFSLSVVLNFLAVSSSSLLKLCSIVDNISVVNICGFDCLVQCALFRTLHKDAEGFAPIP